MNYIQEIQNELKKHIKVSNRLLSYYSLLVITLGEDTTLADIHDAWAVEKNIKMPEHKSIILFEDLTPEVQELDRKYMEAVHKTTKILRKKGII